MSRLCGGKGPHGKMSQQRTRHQECQQQVRTEAQWGQYAMGHGPGSGECPWDEPIPVCPLCPDFFVPASHQP